VAQAGAKTASGGGPALCSGVKIVVLVQIGKRTLRSQDIVREPSLKKRG
jgi:hypothetical protein